MVPSRWRSRSRVPVRLSRIAERVGSAGRIVGAVPTRRLYRGEVGCPMILDTPAGWPSLAAAPRASRWAGGGVHLSPRWSHRYRCRRLLRLPACLTRPSGPVWAGRRGTHGSVRAGCSCTSSRRTFETVQGSWSTTVSTYSPKPGDITREWHVIDANDVVLGRLAVTAATLLRGKHKPTFAPHVDGGDFVDRGQRLQGRALAGNKRTTRWPPALRSSRRASSRSPSGELLDRDPRQGRRARRLGDAPQEPAEPPADQEAQGLRRPRAPAQRAAAAGVRDHPDRPVTYQPPGPPPTRSSQVRNPSCLKTTDTDEVDPVHRGRPRDRVPLRGTPASGTAGRARPSSPPPAPPAGARRPSPGSASFPAPAQWTSTAARSSEYFPNKVHQQSGHEPFAPPRLAGSLRRDRPDPRRWRDRSGRRAAARRGPLPQRDRRGGQPPGPEEGRHADPRRPDQGAQEGRPEEGPQGSAVQQALSLVGASDGSTLRY